MKKLIVLLLIVNSLLSCGQSVYYEFIDSNHYATFEITNKNSSIYRSSNATEDAYVSYIYVESGPWLSNSKSSSAIGIARPAWLYFIKNKETKFDLCGFVYESDFPLGIQDVNSNELLIYNKVSNDSIVLVGKSKENVFLKHASCFEDNNIDWLPPYFTRVKKIDYKKFNLPQIEDKYLKDPIKAPKVYDK